MRRASSQGEVYDQVVVTALIVIGVILFLAVDAYILARVFGARRSAGDYGGVAVPGETTVTVHRERASYTLPEIDLSLEADSEEHYRVREGDPSATTAETRATWRLSRDGWNIRTETSTCVACTPTAFEVKATMQAFESGELVVTRLESEPWMPMSVPDPGE